MFAQNLSNMLRQDLEADEVYPPREEFEEQSLGIDWSTR